MSLKNKKEIDKEGLNEVISLSKKLLNVLYVFMIIGIVLLGLFICVYSGLIKVIVNILNVLAPLFIGFVIAWLFNPLVKKLTKKGINRIISALIVYCVFLILIVVFIRVFIPVLYSQINDLIASIPSVISKLNDVINEFVMSFNTKSIDLSSVKDSMIENLGNMIINYTNTLPNTIVNFIVVLLSG